MFFGMNGNWSDWSMWSQCDVTCESGHAHRWRNCSNPAPQPGGNICTGVDSESRACKLNECPVQYPLNGMYVTTEGLQIYAF
ncbi:CADN-like protein [Mya arenaria]|uniref:CADN-like protein n=1 Tax=Mya arenaria TaxID=6604 RepID=A0ABY7FUF2_MYAAR|nr:CADN-like protein [Mya arenaria]